MGAEIALADELVKVDAEVGMVVDTLKHMNGLVQDLLDALDAIPDSMSFMGLITSGQIKKLSDIWKAFSVAEQFPKLVNDLRSAVPGLTNVATRVQTLAPQIQHDLVEILSESWLNDPGIAAEVTGDAKKAVERVQTLLRNRLVGIVDDTVKKGTAFFASTAALPFHGAHFSVEARVASYQRWSDASFDLPCSRTKTEHYEVAGFKGSFDYPEFYNCRQGPYKVPWPNHHIPYLRFRFDGPSVAQMARLVSPPVAEIEPLMASLAAESFEVASAAKLLDTEVVFQSNASSQDPASQARPVLAPVFDIVS